MAPTVLTAPYRLILQYTVGAIQHKAHYYLNVVTSADPMGFNTVARPGFTGVGLSTVGARIWNVLKTFYNPAESSFDSETLEKLVSGAWVYQVSQAATVAPTGGGNYAPASMITFSGKDQNNRNFPVYFYEMFFGGFLKATSYAGMSAANKAIADCFFNPGGVAVNGDAVAWRISRGSVYSQRWLALVADSNEKLRRIRGIK